MTTVSRQGWLWGVLVLAAGLGETEPICCSCGSQLPGSGSGWSLGPGILGSEAPSISPVSAVTSRAVNTRGLAHVTRDHGAVEHYYIGDLWNSQHGKLRNVGDGET